MRTIYPNQSNIIYPKIHPKDVVSSLWQGVRQSWISLVISIICIITASIFTIIIPLYYKHLFDALTLSDNSINTMSFQDKAVLSSQLLHIILIIFGFNILKWSIGHIGGFASVRFSSKSMATLREQAYNSLQYHSYGFFSNNFTGALVQKISRYARAIDRLVDRIIFDLLPLIVRITGTVIVVWAIKPGLAIFILCWVLVNMAVNYFYSLWRLPYNIKAAEADSHTTATLADAITNQNNIDVFNHHKNELKYFKKATTAQQKATLLNWNINNWLDAIQSGLIILVEFFIFYFAIHYWQEGIVSLGTFVLIQLYILGLGSSLWGFSRIIRDFYESYADAKEMVEIMKLPYEIKNIPTAKPLRIFSGEVVFNNVSFSFNNNRKILKNINIKIKAGEKVALVGPSGAGKTTFARLLLRFHDVTSGEIIIDGQNIHNVTLESLREAIGLVPQDPLLFHRTIMENIHYGKPSATDAEVMKAAELAYCDEFVKGLSQKYNTYVGERGIKLSGGERQRVAIARAILKNAPILILDEATSSLDSHSESLIQSALDTLMKNKTVIVVAHRLSTIRKMDRIVVMKEGGVLEEGTHENLIKEENGLYAKLWNLQAGGFVPKIN
jgi:ATP-binding cassette subfamily B protein